MVRICLLLTLMMVYVAAEQEWLVDVVTADEELAGTTKAKVAIKLEGDLATSKWMRLVNNPNGLADLKHGSTKFTVSTELDLGKLHSIRLNYRDWGWWKLNNIIVTETKSKQTAKFPYLEWLRQPQTLSLRSSSIMSGQNGYEGWCTETNECSPSLSCIDGGCLCHRHEYHVYDKVHGDICRKKKDYYEWCTSTWECKSAFQCRDSVCICGSDENYINGKCHKKKYGGPCETRYNCPQGMVCTDYKNTKCACPANQYYDDNDGLCHKKKDYHDDCTDTKECTSNFVCYDSVCICGPRKDYIHGECHNRPCKNNGYCYQGMVCSKNTGYCTCPDNQYYDDNDGLCHNK